jgi:hypothetical protein
MRLQTLTPSAEVGLDVGGSLADSGQVDAEQLRAAVERGRDRPGGIGIVPFLGRMTS